MFFKKTNFSLFPFHLGLLLTFLFPYHFNLSLIYFIYALWYKSVSGLNLWNLLPTNLTEQIQYLDMQLRFQSLLNSSGSLHIIHIHIIHIIHIHIIHISTWTWTHLPEMNECDWIKYGIFWGVGGSRSARREPTQTWSGHMDHHTNVLPWLFSMCMRVCGAHGRCLWKCRSCSWCVVLVEVCSHSSRFLLLDGTWISGRRNYESHWNVSWRV